MTRPRCSAAATTLFLFSWIASYYPLDAFVVRPPHHHSLLSKNYNHFRLQAKSKKKGKKKKSNDKKQSGFEWASSFTLKPFESDSTRELVSSALSSFEGRTGSPLTSELVGDLPKALWNSKEVAFVIMDQSGEESPIVKYANVAALESVGLKPDEYPRLLGGDGVEQPIVLDLPTEMKGEKRYESGYKKKILRCDEDGDVTVLDAYRWALDRPALIDGKFTSTTIGICYAWSEWAKGEDMICQPGGVTKPLLKEEDLEEAVTKQAALVRKLKEEDGLGNKDPAVVDAVKELLRLKDQIASLSN